MDCFIDRFTDVWVLEKLISAMGGMEVCFCGNCLKSWWMEGVMYR